VPQHDVNLEFKIKNSMGMYRMIY